MISILSNNTKILEIPLREQKDKIMQMD